MSYFEPSASSNFLINYIKENPDCPIDDIINDDELLDTLKYNNEALFS
jgi:hypothetical protein